MATSSEAIRTEVMSLPPNAKLIINIFGTFLIQNIKRSWTSQWENLKMGMILKGKWMEKSGHLINPGKSFFLKRSAQEVRDVYNQRDKHGLN